MRVTMAIAACVALLVGVGLASSARRALAQDSAQSVSGDTGAAPTATAPVRASDPLPPHQQERIRELVSDLSDPSYRVRESASRELRARGNEVLPYLAEADRSRDLELRRRARALSEEIRDGVGAPPSDEIGRTDRVRGLSRWRDRLGGPDSSLQRMLEDLRQLEERFQRSFEAGRVPGLDRGAFERWFESFPGLERGFDIDMDAEFGDWEKLGPDFGHALKGRYQVWRDGEKIADREFGSESASSRQLGVRVESVHPALRAQLALRDDEGLLVVEVVPESAADAAGFEVYDLITAVDGIPVDRPTQLRERLATGEAMQVSILRKGQRQSLKVELPAAKPRGSVTSERR